MDRQDTISIVRAMGGYLIADSAGTSVCGLSPRDQDIFDLMADDFDALVLDWRIEIARNDKKVLDMRLRELLVKSSSWNTLQLALDEDADSKELAMDTARHIHDCLHEHPGAIFLEGLETGWELWIKTGAK